MDEKAIHAITGALNRPAEFHYDQEHHVVLAPPGYTPHDLSKFLPPADRPKQKLDVLTASDFIQYVLRFKRDGRTAIFADETSGLYESVLDYHGPQDNSPLPPPPRPSVTDKLNEPKLMLYRERGSCEHVVTYKCPESDHWKLWMAGNGKAMDQVAFALFIEENALDVTSPPAAALLDTMLQFEVHKSAKFLSEERLDNGQRQFRYEEDVRGTTKAGTLSIPQSFSIKIPVFFGGTPITIDARFRWRLNGAALQLWYELVRPTEVRRVAIAEISKQIMQGCAEIPFYRGKRLA